MHIVPDLSEKINIVDCLEFRCGEHSRVNCPRCIVALKRENEQLRGELEIHVCPAYKQAVSDSLLKRKLSRYRTVLDLIIIDDITPNKILKEVRRAHKDVEEMERNT